MLRVSFTSALAAVALVGLTSGISANTIQQPPPAPATAGPRATDDTLKDRVLYRLETAPATKKYDIKVKVDNGVAALSGSVATEAQKVEAGRLAKVDGITRVDNTITVDKDADNTLVEHTKAGLSKTGENINDAWITTKVKWFFVGEDALKGSNINVDTANSVVTLKGTVKSGAGRSPRRGARGETPKA